MKKSIDKYWIISLFIFGIAFFIPEKQVQAQTYTDSIAFKIDSAKIENSNLIYSIMFWRTNKDWRGAASAEQDTVMGNLDLYFWMKDIVFDGLQSPVILRHHPNLNGANCLLDISALYHADRFLIKLESKATLSPAMKGIGIPYNEPVELCKIQMPLQYNDRNPEFVWDTKATGGQSYIGEPLIKELQGDIYQNPDPSIVLEDYTRIEYFCQGGTAKIWAKGYSAGTAQKMSWLMAKKLDFSDAVSIESDIKGSLVGAGQVHYSNTLSTPWGNLFYMVSANNTPTGSRVDTLIIPNVPGWLDSMYFQCIISDESLSVASKKSTEGDTRIFLRDSIFAWFAASDPAMRDDAATTGIGATDRTDTVLKCPSSESYVSVYFFGPKCGEDINTIGNSMTITYSGKDNIANPFQHTVELTSWLQEAGKTAPNGRCLYRGTVQLPDSITDVDVWISSITTAKGCNNGASYTPYDTVHITNLKGDNVKVVASLTDTTLASGESMALNTRYPYTSYYLKTPALGRLDLGATPKQYYAPNAACTNPGGCADTIVYQYKVGTTNGDCVMDVEQIVNISDWFYLAPKIYLEGAYRAASNKMTTYYLSNNLLPHTSSYADNVLVPVFPAGKPIVDWIYISVRKTDIRTVVTETSAFLLEDGTICDTVGRPYVRFKNLDPNEKYFVVVSHRNHLRARSKCSYYMSQTESMPTFIDFTQTANVGGEKLAEIGVNIYGLFMGEISPDDVISGADKSLLIMSSGAPGYNICDLDFDGVVSGKDKSVFLNNIGAAAGLYTVSCP